MEEKGEEIPGSRTRWRQLNQIQNYISFVHSHQNKTNTKRVEKRKLPYFTLFSFEKKFGNKNIEPSGATETLLLMLILWTQTGRILQNKPFNLQNFLIRPARLQNFLVFIRTGYFLKVIASLARHFDSLFIITNSIVCVLSPSLAEKRLTFNFQTFTICLYAQKSTNNFARVWHFFKVAAAILCNGSMRALTRSFFPRSTGSDRRFRLTSNINQNEDF